MSQRLRHRLVMFMIAVMAIMAFARAGAMDNTMGSMAGMQMCHGAGIPMAMQPGEPSAGHRPADGAMPDHACCKVCVCHPGFSALPPGFHACVLPAAARAIETAAARVVAAAGVFSTKSSPRGPPAHVDTRSTSINMQRNDYVYQIACPASGTADPHRSTSLGR